MELIEMLQYQFNNLVKLHENYDFPEFLRRLRRITKISRKKISNEIGISEVRLHYLENGKFKRTPGKEEAYLLAEFYGVDRDLMIRKLQEFMDKKSSITPAFKIAQNAI